MLFTQIVRVVRILSAVVIFFHFKTLFFVYTDMLLLVIAFSFFYKCSIADYCLPSCPFPVARDP